MSPTEVQKKSHTGERYLCFTLGSEQFALPLLSVKEVIAVPEVTPIPFCPPYFQGIMNLRGQVLSVIDLRTKMNIKPHKSSENAVIICDLGTFSMGVMVDSIDSVVAPSADDFSDKPEVQSSINTDFIMSVFRYGKKLVLLLDVAKALSVEDLKMIKGQKTAQKVAA